MASFGQTVRWTGFTFDAAWRLSAGTIKCLRASDPVAADRWLIDTLVPRIFSVTGADYRPPPTLPPLPDAPYIIIANHQSHLDVPVIMSTLPLTIRMVAKPSLFRLPIFGRYMRTAGHLVARRKAEVMSASRTLLDRGYSVGFFPEGTRTPEGELGPFKSGAFTLAAESGRPLLPVVVYGTGRVLPRGENAPQPGPVALRVGSPVPPGSDIDALMAAGRHALQGLLDQGPPPEMA